MLKVFNIFRSIQGEGIDIGMPTIFIRFVGCNLKCDWCDTQYASRDKSKYKEMASLEIITEVNSFFDTKSVTLTGGEPFIQDIKDLDKLIYELKGNGYFINIETNGVALPKLKYLKFVDRFSISPKLKSSGNKNAIILKTLNKYIDLYAHKMFLKFVISNKKDFEEMLEILNKLKGCQEKNIQVVVQPNIDDTTVKSIGKQSERFLKLLDLVLNDYAYKTKFYNIRIIPQFHKYLWLNKRGV